MRKRDRAELISRELERLYPTPQIPLVYTDAYTMLIAVLLSAQCTDIRVNQVTPKLFELARTPQEMALLAPETVREIIRPCGLSERKAQSIVQLSQILVNQYEGQVPDDFELLESLPGVGHKTASVVMGQAFGVPSFPVDTHIYRLARKWKLSNGSNVRAVEEDLKALFPKASWLDLHLRIIWYGREHCPARGCRNSCTICPMIGVGRDD